MTSTLRLLLNGIWAGKDGKSNTTSFPSQNIKVLSSKTVTESSTAKSILFKLWSNLPVFTAGWILPRELSASLQSCICYEVAGTVFIVLNTQPERSFVTSPFTPMKRFCAVPLIKKTIKREALFIIFTQFYREVKEQSKGCSHAFI